MARVCRRKAARRWQRSLALAPSPPRTGTWVAWEATKHLIGRLLARVGTPFACGKGPLRAERVGSSTSLSGYRSDITRRRTSPAKTDFNPARSFPNAHPQPCYHIPSLHRGFLFSITALLSMKAGIWQQVGFPVIQDVGLVGIGGDDFR